MCNTMMVAELNPGVIRYTQNSIKPTFKDDTNIYDTLTALLNGDCKVTAIPAIHIFGFNSLWWSLDNRRLWVFKMLAIEGGCKTIPVNVVDQVDVQKITTKNQGISVKIRSPNPSTQSKRIIHHVPGIKTLMTKATKTAIYKKKSVQSGNVVCRPACQTEDTERTLSDALSQQPTTKIAQKLKFRVTSVKVRRTIRAKNKASSQKALMLNSTEECCSTDRGVDMHKSGIAGGLSCLTKVKPIQKRRLPVISTKAIKTTGTRRKVYNHLQIVTAHKPRTAHVGKSFDASVSKIRKVCSSKIKTFKHHKTHDTGSLNSSTAHTVVASRTRTLVASKAKIKVRHVVSTNVPPSRQKKACNISKSIAKSTSLTGRKKSLLRKTNSTKIVTSTSHNQNTIALAKSAAALKNCVKRIKQTYSGTVQNAKFSPQHNTGGRQNPSVLPVKHPAPRIQHRNQSHAERPKQTASGSMQNATSLPQHNTGVRQNPSVLPVKHPAPRIQHRNQSHAERPKQTASGSMQNATSLPQHNTGGRQNSSILPQKSPQQRVQHRNPIHAERLKQTASGSMQNAKSLPQHSTGGRQNPSILPQKSPQQRVHPRNPIHAERLKQTASGSMQNAKSLPQHSTGGRQNPSILPQKSPQQRVQHRNPSHAERPKQTASGSMQNAKSLPQHNTGGRQNPPATGNHSPTKNKTSPQSPGQPSKQARNSTGSNNTHKSTPGQKGRATPSSSKVSQGNRAQKKPGGGKPTRK